MEAECFSEKSVSTSDTTTYVRARRQHLATAAPSCTACRPSLQLALESDSLKQLKRDSDSRLFARVSLEKVRVSLLHADGNATLTANIALHIPVTRSVILRRWKPRILGVPRFDTARMTWARFQAATCNFPSNTTVFRLVLGGPHRLLSNGYQGLFARA